MSKILVVETHRMLQQAIALALFPEHEVKIVSAIPESSELKDFDAVIVDVGSIGESDGDFEPAIRAVRSWRIPTVWVQSSSHGQTPQREKLVALNPPIEKEVLLSALAECLGIPSREKPPHPSTRAPALVRDSRSGFRPTGSPAGRHKAAGSTGAIDNQRGAPAPAGDSEVIELFDIVEEGSESEFQQAQQKN
jgi:hypothetical protein